MQAVTRHKTERMTEIYSHFDPMEFTEVPMIQEELLRLETGKQGGESEARRPVVLRIVKPEQKMA